MWFGAGVRAHRRGSVYQRCRVAAASPPAMDPIIGRLPQRAHPSHGPNRQRARHPRSCGPVPSLRVPGADPRSVGLTDLAGSHLRMDLPHRLRRQRLRPTTRQLGHVWLRSCTPEKTTSLGSSRGGPSGPKSDATTVEDCRCTWTASADAGAPGPSEAGGPATRQPSVRSSGSSRSHVAKYSSTCASLPGRQPRIRCDAPAATYSPNRATIASSSPTT